MTRGEPTSEGPEAAAGHILRARAQALARPDAAGGAVQSLELLEFALARERYALETRYVREVQALRGLTQLPCTPAFVLGIANVRGRIVAVLDLRHFFELPKAGLTNQHRMIVVGTADLEFGLLADEVEGVRSTPVDDVQPSLATLSGIRSEYLKGVTAERLVVLDAARILGDPRIVVHEDVQD